LAKLHHNPLPSPSHYRRKGALERRSARQIEEPNKPREMCAATSEMCASIMPHHVMREEPLQPLLPLLLPRCNHAAPEPLGPSAAMIATPHLKSRLHPLPRGRGWREAIADEKGGAEREGRRRCARGPAEEEERGMGEVTESEREMHGA